MAMAAKRKPNFSDAEKFRLCDEYEREFSVLTSKFSPTITNKKKHEAWERITANLNKRSPSVTRSAAEFMKKWQTLCSAMKDEYRVYKKKLGQTGIAVNFKFRIFQK